jgi:hypothetical protein
VSLCVCVCVCVCVCACVLAVVYCVTVCVCVSYYPEVFNLSGGWDNVKKFGDWFTYDKTPRALIFKRDQSNVVDIPSLIKLMRHAFTTNDFDLLMKLELTLSTNLLMCQCIVCGQVQ